MKAIGLTIGNWLSEYGTPVQVTSTKVTEPWYLGIEHTPNSIGATHGNSLDPISITEDWMYKFGFKRRFIPNINVFEFRIGDFALTTRGGGMAEGKEIVGDITLTSFLGNPSSGYERVKDILFVHELQNFYFSCIGKEL